MYIWHAHASTRSFEFDAYGRTKAEAMDALRRTWKLHKRQTDAEYSFEDIGPQVHQVTLGQGYRDGEPCAS